MSTLITPRTLSGFRDYLPNVMLARERVLQIAREVYRSYGFTPIDTPACEALDVLLGKGGDESDKLVYRVRSAKSDKEEMGLRFDLTVPFARFSAQHIDQVGTPFKRYHMGPVWRGENIQRGRYREFWQCDFDTIGTTSNAADIEVALVIHDLMRGLNLDRFVIHINNRLVLNGLLEELGLAGKTAAVLRSLDKLGKVSREEVQAEMSAGAGVTIEQSRRLLDFVQTMGTNADIIERLKKEFGANARAAEGRSTPGGLPHAVSKAGVPDNMIVLDLSIARPRLLHRNRLRDLLTDMPKIGSVCSGGRYDNLAGLYTKQSLPGVGASLGLDRLLAALEELNLLQKSSTPAPVFIVQFSADRIGEYQRMARSLRAAGIGAEVFPDAKKIGQQSQYAEKRGHRIGLIAGPGDFAAGPWNVKDLASARLRRACRRRRCGAVQAMCW